jgi:hypothetical protein
MANPRDAGQGAPGHRHPERASAPPPPLRHPERAFAPWYWPAPATEHRDRATTPEASSPRPRDRGRDRTVGQLGPRADGQPGWLDGERKQRPLSYRATTATLPRLPANSRTPPAVVATEGVHAGQAHSKERSEPARRYVSSPRPCPVPPTLPQLNGGPRGPRLTLGPRVCGYAHARLPGCLPDQVTRAAAQPQSTALTRADA